MLFFLLSLVSTVVLAQGISHPYWGTPFEVNTSPFTEREYRSLDGHGNNVEHPDWGTEEVPFLRHTMPAAYYSGPIDPSDPTSPMAAPEDGIDPTLPLERWISNMLIAAHGKHKPNSVLINQIHIDWGHLVIVDLINSISIFPARIEGLFERLKIPPGDVWADESWGEVGPAATCLQNSHGNCVKAEDDLFIYAPRWTPFPGTGRGTGVPKAQYGDVSQWLDLSALYGNPLRPQKVFHVLEMSPWIDVSEDGEILNNGKLNDLANGFDLGPLLMPYVYNSEWKAAGDFRFNKTPGLRVLLETFKREHNRLVDQFAAEHPEWDAYTLFQEARRWNIAFFQSITFREYLAAATGEPLPPYDGYKPDVNPGVDHFYADVAARYGHSALPSLIPLLDNDLNYCPFGALEARDIFLPSLWYTPDRENPWTDPITGEETSELRLELYHEAIIRGLAHSAANDVDISFVDDLRNFLSQVGGPRHGEDLITFDIFRGRDAGIPHYNDAREYFGFPRVEDFDEITSDKAVAGMLKKIYGDVDRIDAYVGTFAEEHQHTELGPLARASLQEQFLRLRDGDRFYYENDQFTPKEVETIESTKLTDLLLRNWPELIPSALPVNSFYLNERQLQAFRPDQTFPEPEPHPKGLPWAHKELTSAYHLYWAIDRHVEPREITIEIQVQTAGWAGIGFGPEAFGSMKGADIVLCREVEGVGECLDMRAFYVGVPYVDAEYNGGEYSLRDVSVNRTDGILFARFTRDMSTGDEFDNDIGDDLRIIFAFNPATNDLKYHGPTRNPDVVMNFEADYLGPPEQVPISRGVTIFLYVLCGIGASLSFFYMIIVIVKTDYFRFQTPEFCVLVCFGSLLGYASVLLILPDSQNDATCKAHIWLFGMSFWIVFLGFFIKVARVYYVVKRAEKTFTVTVLPFWKLFIPLIIFMLGETAFNICWDVLLPPDLEREDFPEDNTYILYCGGNTGMWAGSVAFRATFLGLGSLLAILTKDMPQELNWSKEIAMSIYTSAIVLFIGIPLGFALVDSASMVVMLKGLTICIAYIAVTGIVHSDSLKRMVMSKGPRDQTKASHSVTRTKNESTA